MIFIDIQLYGEKFMKTKSGIYKLQHTSGVFYIGSTSDMKSRWAQHKSLFKNNRNLPLLQKVYNKSPHIEEWTMTTLEYCSKIRLKKCEDKHLIQHYNNPLCLNVKRTGGNIGRRGLTVTQRAADNQAIALLGKNTSDGKVRRKKAVTFISPEGKKYTNIISVKRFCRELGLPQPAMNNLANQVLHSVYGWTLEGGKQPKVSDILEYWPEERVEQNYTPDIVIGPDGTRYKVYATTPFEQQHNCRIIRKSAKTGCSAKYKGLDKYGRGYRLAHVPVFTFEYQGKTYTNVLSISKLCHTLGLTYETVRQSMLNKHVYKRKYAVYRQVTDFPTN